MLNLLLHVFHRFSKLIGFIIYILGAFYHFGVKYLIRINKICHFTAENRGMRDHLARDSRALWNNIFHFLCILEFVSCFHEFWELFRVFNLKPLNQELIWFELFASNDRLHESTQVELPSFYGLFWVFLLFHWKRRHHQIWVIFDQNFT